MNRSQLIQLLSDISQQKKFNGVDDRDPERCPSGDEIFVWFEDTSAQLARRRALCPGLPESLLPIGKDIKVLDRRYVPDHLHLLSAVRIYCANHINDRVAAIYSAALSVGSVAWIGIGVAYESAWNRSYPIPEAAPTMSMRNELPTQEMVQIQQRK